MVWNFIMMDAILEVTVHNVRLQDMFSRILMMDVLYIKDQEKFLHTIMIMIMIIMVKVVIIH
jgi:hypothetical protein